MGLIPTIPQKGWGSWGYPSLPEHSWEPAETLNLSAGESQCLHLFSVAITEYYRLGSFKKNKSSFVSQIWRLELHEHGT
jgi:hypothetical protein